jgi:hypothetical protein
VKKDTAYSNYFIDSYLVMKKYAWFICLIPDEEICHDYLQSEKGVEQKLYSVVVSHRPNGTSCAQKKQLLTGSVIAVKGVSRWSLDEHIPFRGESEKVRRERPSPGRQTLFRRNPAGCRIIDSKNHKIVHKINSCDHRGLIRY